MGIPLSSCNRAAYFGFLLPLPAWARFDPPGRHEFRVPRFQEGFSLVGWTDFFCKHSEDILLFFIGVFKFRFILSFVGKKGEPSCAFFLSNWIFIRSKGILTAITVEYDIFPSQENSLSLPFPFLAARTRFAARIIAFLGPACIHVSTSHLKAGFLSNEAPVSNQI